MGFSENLKAFRSLAGMSRAKLGAMLDPEYTGQAVYNWEVKGYAPPTGVVSQLARIFGTSVEALLGENLIRLSVEPSSATLPMLSLGMVHAGEFEGEDEELSVVQAPESVVLAHPHAFFLQVVGDCMELDYPEGCLVLVDPDMEPSNGRAVVAEVEREYVLRRFDRFNDTLVLSSHSRTLYPDMVFRDQDVEVSVLGTVVWFQAREDLR